MSKKRPLLSPLFLFFILSISAAPVWTQVPEGVIQGIVLTESGQPIEAATVYISSPALLGVRIVLTEKAGLFDVPGLLPGGYTLTAEKPGFKTIVLETIDLRAGQTAFVRITLSPSEQEEEMSLARLPLTGDIASPRKVSAVERMLIDRLPLGRNFTSLLRATPGIFSVQAEANENLAPLGSPSRSSAYRLDGVNFTDNLTLTPLFSLDTGIIEELEITSAGQSLAQNPAGGTQVNVITRSGGNTTSGEMGFHLIVDDWNKDLWSPSEITTEGVPAVAGIRNYVEPFLSLGGPIWVDRGWFFLSGRLLSQSKENIFKPFQDAVGQPHSLYDWSRRQVSGFFKATARPISNAQLAAWVNLAHARQPVAEEPSPRLPYLSTHVLDRDNSLALHGSGHYFLDQNTIVSAKASYLQRTALSLLQPEAGSLFWRDDEGDGYGPLSGGDFNSETHTEQLYGEVSARKFVPRWAGVKHTLSAGFNYLQTTSSIDWWRENNLLWFLDHRRPYFSYYPQEGLVGFWLCGAVQNSTLVRGQIQRLGGYISDTLSLGRWLTLNLGLRLDRMSGGFGGTSKSLSGSALSSYVGEAVIKPLTKAAYPTQFPNGLNPWETLSFINRDDLISWLFLSPRVGLVANLRGEGKTLLKASYARYRDDLTMRDLLPLHPLSPNQLSFFWRDANGDSRPDSSDEFNPLSFDFRSLSDSFFLQRVAEDIASPVTEEISVGGEQFIGHTISFGLRFISRHEKEIPAFVLYDPDSGKTWFRGQENPDAWIPFTTTVPSNGNFPAQNITVFVRSINAPPVFWQWRNVPELERKYRAIEFSLEKKMAHGWQFSGTLLLSRTEGNAAGVAAPLNWIETRGIDANYFVNRYGRLTSDRPVVLKLQAAAELPSGFMLSAYFQYQSGQPWERSGRVLPPADWCVAYQGERIYYPVYFESAGARREKSSSSLDGRLEKAFSVGEKSQLCLALDVLNILGQKRALRGLNDVDIWEPSAEGEGKPGRLILAPDYQLTNALLGKRTFRLIFKLSF